MRISTRTTVLATLLGFPLSTFSSTVQRCEDAEGHITFTTLGCPIEHSVRLQDAYNAPPGSSVPLLPEASRSFRGDVKAREVVVVGQHDDGCGNQITREQRRRAIINQQPRAGMTLRDVESALGKPDKIASQNGETRYYYSNGKNRSSQVVFDEEGCVKAKR